MVEGSGDSVVRCGPCARAIVIDDIIANPETYKQLTYEAARREHPEMTEEQHEAEWQYVKQLLGL
jgi:hypothetical protein